MFEVLFVYAGVPCETYSIAGRTNKGRDLHKTVHVYNFRLTDTERNPCCPETSECPYADKACLDSAMPTYLHIRSAANVAMLATLCA